LENSAQPIVTIGIPAFNSAQSISKTINSVLNQTFKNFELIISDNASTDSTSSICMEYAKKDPRIKYIRQEKNIFIWPNFNYLVNLAEHKYFVWLGADDYWESTFLEKNVSFLESNPNFVGSIGEIDFFGKYLHRYQTNGKFLKHSSVKPMLGSYPEKIKLLLKTPASMMYGVYRTDPLKKSIVKNNRLKHEYEFLIPLLKYGDFNVLDDVLLHRSADGMSSRGQFRLMRNFEYTMFEILTILIPIFKLLLRDLGIKFIFKNFGSCLHLVYVNYGRLVLDLLRKIKKI